MNKKSRQKIRAYIANLFRSHQDIVWCDYWSEKEQDVELKSALKIVKNSYARDPDVVGHYYNATRKLQNNKYETVLEREVLEAFRDVASRILEEAEYKAMINRQI
ncbi:MAG: hypothetical protein COU51_03385 [Parcubacteria group bacterium CG10_big_fil_rev_8_21_14_0_10_36_14]|nr:MAG: hypothetical protein COU51_03385 [Parcubacteria group bacterium CG10_big_fil_rev_8_21_14_0_10_36_14]